MGGRRLEVGGVYREKKTGRLFLAVDISLLLTFRAGRPREHQPTGDYEILRGLSVDTLVQIWEISVAQLDAVALKYLDPPSHRNVGVRQRRSKRRGGEEEEFVIFRAIRLYKSKMPNHKST